MRVFISLKDCLKFVVGMQDNKEGLHKKEG